MSYTTEIHDQEARKMILKGAKRVYKAVSTTLGPRGRNVIINKGYDTEVLHDGVKVSRYISPKDKYEKAGADLIREAAEKHVSKVGDGTTLTTILAYHITDEAMTLIDSGVDAMSLKEGLEKGRDILVEEIEKLAKPVKTEKQKIQVASVAAQDKELGEMIGKTYHKIGLDGVIVADDSNSSVTKLEHEEGISLDKGWISPYFITNTKNMTAVVKDVYILITDMELDDIYEFLEFVKKVLEPDKIKNLLIIAAEAKGTFLPSIIETKRRGMMNVLVVKAPSFGAYRKELLEDLAVMTGGKFIEDGTHTRLKDLTLDDLGYADAVKASRESTTILGNKGDTKEIKKRIDSIRHLIKNPGNDTEYDSEKLKERLAKMTGGVYVVRTGGETEIEVAEKKERVEDSILATRSAIVSGIVPGGEVTFLKILDTLEAKNPAEEYAFRILTHAIQEPFNKLLSNAGMDSGYYRAKLEGLSFGHGVDVTDGKVKDLIAEGIVDPADVLTEGLKSAVSVAILMLTSNVISAVHEDEVKK